MAPPRGAGQGLGDHGGRWPKSVEYVLIENVPTRIIRYGLLRMCTADLPCRACKPTSSGAAVVTCRPPLPRSRTCACLDAASIREDPSVASGDGGETPSSSSGSDVFHDARSGSEEGAGGPDPDTRPDAATAEETQQQVASVSGESRTTGVDRIDAVVDGSLCELRRRMPLPRSQSFQSSVTFGDESRPAVKSFEILHEDSGKSGDAQQQLAAGSACDGDQETAKELCRDCRYPVKTEADCQYPNNLLILILPGNPGVADFYDEFMARLFKRLRGQVPVWGLSHAGHADPPPNYASFFHQNNRGDRAGYRLEGQIQHKADFVRRFVPRAARLVLVGHSIGCYIALELMRRLSDRVDFARSYLLFPTIERMAQTPQGKAMLPWLDYRRAAMPPLYALWYTPRPLKSRLLSWYFSSKNVSECCHRAIHLMMNPTCAENMMFMGRDELATVRSLDVATVKRFLPRLTFLYGRNDHWCPVSYYHDMKSLFPEGDIHLCDTDIDHAFVLESSEAVADICAQWITEQLL